MVKILQPRFIMKNMNIYVVEMSDVQLLAKPRKLPEAIH